MHPKASSSLPTIQAIVMSSPWMIALQWTLSASSIACLSGFLADEGVNVPRHGDMLHLKIAKAFYQQPIEVLKDTEPGKVETAEEDQVDRLLRTQDGLIRRDRDSAYCKHGSNGMCAHCQPLEPFDAGYQAAQKIKHSSFHAYLRKLAAASAHDIGPLLEVRDYCVRKDCPGGHPPYPEGLCSKCQPPAIVLSQQPFRLVDHVEVTSSEIIEQGLLAAWRETGLQRFAWLLGRYEPYEAVPLGIKAVVSAVYVPPQDGSVDGLQLILPDPSEGVATRLAEAFGLGVVGMAYTDLTDDGSRSGKVVSKRSSATYFVSSTEALFMAEQQLSHPSPCRDSPTGIYSSKLVTMVLTGNDKAEVDLQTWQVSQAAEAMVQASLLDATTDPSLVMVRPLEAQHYVPDVIYRHADEYGNLVQRRADPFFPVEYLLLTLSHGFPMNARPIFRSTVPFPQPSATGPPLSAVKRYLMSAKDQPPMVYLSNFNLLLFLALSGKFTEAAISELCKAVATQNHDQLKAFLTSPSWVELLAQLEASTGPPASSEAPGRRDWQCPHCTFFNVGRVPDQGCEMCGLPFE